MANITWVGTLPAWITVATVVIVGYYFKQGAGGTALATLETANRVLEAANKALESRVKILEEKGGEDARVIAELKARTDVAVQIQPLVKWTGEHEHRDQQRFEKTIEVLGEIADRLAPGTGSGMKIPPQRV